jgi:sporulation protein YlmC with PRC-barrel domain
MMVLSSALINKPVASVQSGHKVATTADMIIDPRNLKVFAFKVISPKSPNLVLHTEDVRNVTPQGLVIDHNNQLMTFDEDLVRLNEVAKINFVLIDKPVYADDKKKVGKVSDFATETQDFMIMKLHVTRSLLKSFGSSQLIIDRSQIVQITDDHIVVKSTALKEKATDIKTAVLGKPASLSPESIKTESQTK